jgi:hypothetical protein
VRKARGRSHPLTAAGLRTLGDEHDRTLAPMPDTATEALSLEQTLSDLVNAAYGLTPEDIALMWQTAPRRMPLSPHAATPTT